VQLVLVISIRRVLEGRHIIISVHGLDFNLAVFHHGLLLLLLLLIGSNGHVEALAGVNLLKRGMENTGEVHGEVATVEVLVNEDAVGLIEPGMRVLASSLQLAT